MKRKEIARRSGRRADRAAAAARDEIAELVHKILKSLKKGKPVELPGLGKLVRAKPR